jgi:hypothetical protein
VILLLIEVYLIRKLAAYGKHFGRNGGIALVEFLFDFGGRGDNIGLKPP